MNAISHKALFWRKLAHWGASKGPEWWVRYSPPVFGWAAAALVPPARRAVHKNLLRIRGPVSRARNAKEILATFSTYASCLAEALSNDSETGPRAPQASIVGLEHALSAFALERGVVLVTAHTAGWDIVGPLLARHHALPPMLIVMAQERDGGARALHDDVRVRSGVRIAHVGDPLASLSLLRHVQSGGVVALQLDRTVAGMRTRKVSLLDGQGEVPEGPLRLAQASGAPILPVFCSRIGYRRYVIEVFESISLTRRANDAELDRAAAKLGAVMTTFLRKHPTQWFHF
jgi:KDO2-lipid IV(A) lauroyltransferase